MSTLGYLVTENSRVEVTYGGERNIGHGGFRIFTRWTEQKLIMAMQAMMESEDFEFMLTILGEGKNKLSRRCGSIVRRVDVIRVEGSAPIFIKGNGVNMIVSYNLNQESLTRGDSCTQSLSGELHIHTMWLDEQRTKTYEFRRFQRGITIIDGIAYEAETDVNGQVEVVA